MIEIFYVRSIGNRNIYLNLRIKVIYQQCNTAIRQFCNGLIQRRAIVIEYNIAQPSSSISTTGLTSSNHTGKRDGARI